MRAAAILTLSLLLAGCDLSMRQQDKAEPQGGAELWQSGPARQAPPEGTIALDEPARLRAIATPPPLTAALLDRGQERYGIYCAPCHGAAGLGDGTIVKRGFPPPPSFREPRLVAAPPAYVVQVITRGKGIMYSYADRVAPTDRWAIAAYVKALQQTGGS